MGWLQCRGLLPTMEVHEQVMKRPDHLSEEEAAAVPEAFITAYLELVLLGKLSKGQSLLVHAGASGVGTLHLVVLVMDTDRHWVFVCCAYNVLAHRREMRASACVASNGHHCQPSSVHIRRFSSRHSQPRIRPLLGNAGTAAIQIAREVGACPIFATASTFDKLERAGKLGATHGINYKTEDFLEIIRAETKNSRPATTGVPGNAPPACHANMCPSQHLHDLEKQ